MIYFTSDTHFNHRNIIEYCNRPFKNVDEMNDKLIKNWNSRATDEDIIYHLGDIAFGPDKEHYCGLLNRVILRGNITYIKGNHDHKWKKLLEEGLDLRQGPILLDEYKLILSHKPLLNSEIPEGYLNVHGHIHNSPLGEEFNKKNHICVSTELWDYNLASLEEVLTRAGR